MRSLIWILALSATACGGDEPPATPETETAPAAPLEEEPAEEQEAPPLSDQTEEERERDGLAPRWEAGDEVQVALAATPDVLILNDRPHFRLRLTITNRSGAEMDELPLSEQILVNGRRDPETIALFTTGPRGGEWREVAPGDSGTLIREIGEALFPRPGAYVIAYEHGSARAETRVIVTENAPDARGVSWWLEATEPRPTMGERGQTLLRLSVRNDGAEPVEPGLEAGTWTVNGQPAPALDLTFGNGLRDNSWSRLMPGETASMQRSIESVLAAPGVYEVRYTREDGTDAGVRLTVRPG